MTMQSPQRILLPASWHLSTALLLALSHHSFGGDILRAGGAPSAPARSAGGNEAGAVQAATARANAQDALARTSQALAAVQQLQLQARAAAAQNIAGAGLPVVSNGLGAGGLQPTTNATLWTGANLPTQTTSEASRQIVTVKQTAQQALLNWDSFNVGRQTDLVFDQTAGGASKSQWIAFNTVNDPSGVPSQILGSIKADGQVYVINQNGIIFGGASEVNTHTLVASSLPLNDNLVSRGLLNNPDSQFLFSSLAQPTGPNGTPASVPAAGYAPNGRLGDVTVQAGARLLSPTSADKVGGRIALVGPNVTNAGTIETPDGQTILAAGLQVGMVAHNTNDPTLRGLDVYVGAVTDPASVIPSYAGAAVNSGLISALRASVTITGKEVTNSGAIDSSTSVSLNGRIDLTAHYDAVSVNGVFSLVPFLFRESGLVTLGSGSMARIMPEYASTEKAVGTRLALTSQVNLEGKAVHMAANSSLVAPNANININAGTWAYFPVATPPASRFLQRDGQIYLDAGAILSAAGSSDVEVPASQNFVTAELRSSELADSPLLRNSALRGQRVVVDIRQTGTYNGRAWVGSPIADVSGYGGLVERGAGELTVSGGTVKMSAGSSVVVQQGAQIDVSDGWINYTGASLAATRLISNGDILDISQATPDRIYDGIFTGNAVAFSDQWGVTSIYASPLAPTGRRFEPGGLFGAAAGSLTITSPSMALDGGLYGITVAGPNQRTLLPKISELTLNFQREEYSQTPFAESPTPPAVTIGGGAPLPAAGAFSLDASGNVIPLAAERLAQVMLSPALMTDSGFGALRVNNGDGNITVPAGVNLSAPNQGSIALAGANVNVAGNIASAGGTINLTAYTVSPFEAAKLTSNSSKPASNANRGTVSVASGSTLSTAGLRVDDRLFADDPLGSQLVVNAGTININAWHTLLAGGSVLDVSGGVSVSPSARLTYGTGGAVNVKAGQDPNVDAVTGGTLQLGSTLSGYSGGRGGTLAVTAPAIQVGGGAAPAGVLHLDPAFFSTGGFTGYTMTGTGLNTAIEGQFVPGVFITPGTQINPVAQNWLALTYGTNGGLDLTPILQQEGVRTPLNVTFSAPGVRDNFDSNRQQVRGDLILGEGAAIHTDARATVALRGESVSFLGSVYAPGGTINLSGGNNGQTVFEGSGALTDVALTTLHLGPQSVLSTAGKRVLTPDPRDFLTGTVHAGGTITVTGNIAAEAGALIDVSGTSGELDVAPGFLGSSFTDNNTLQGSERVRTRVDSAAGTINLTGGHQLYMDATLRGNAGGPGVQGGTLNLSSGRFATGLVPNVDFPTLQIVQGGFTIPSAVALGQPITGTNGNALQGMGYFTADQFNSSGLGALTLSGTVQFSGPVNLNAARTLSVATSGVLFADSDVTLTAPYVALGQRFVAPKLAEELLSYTPFTTANNQRLFIQPSTGSGTLTVHATHIDVGNLSLQGIGSASLFADNGDIRGNGTLDIAGTLNLRAGNIYPTTASGFTIAAYDSAGGSGTVNIAGSGARQLPFSAGGTLNIYASVINQGGVLRAPAGTINLGWDGSGAAPKDLLTNQAVPATVQLTLGAGGVTSVSAIDPLTGTFATLPYGTNLSGSAWIDPSGTDITRIGPPSKSVNLSGQNVDVQAGSTLDIRGGGELYAYRWVPGNGGTRDVLASSSTFAVIPNYDSGFAPYAAFNQSTLATNLSGDAGYVNSTISPGDRVWLNASEGLPAGSYTLLPARYALLPGAFLVTPKSGTPGGTVVQPDKSSLVAGYRFNDANAGGQNVLMSNFEVAPVTVVRGRAQYDDFTATAFFREMATNSGTTAPRLPVDGGQLVATAAQNLAFAGSLTALAPAGGRGGLVDISSPLDILIAGPGVAGSPGTLTLRSSDLSSFNAQSLLIGGVRRTAAGGTTVTVKTGSLTVDNAGAPLTGDDIILVSNGSLTVTEGSSILQNGTSAAESLLFGEAAQSGSGNGTLLRLSGDTNARVTRRGITTAGGPGLTVAAGAELRGTSLTLDSTAATMLDPTTRLRSSAINLNSGRISLALDNAGTLQPNAGLVLTGGALDDLQTAQTLSSLSFLSYSSLDIYGTGQVGSTTAQNLELHAAQIRGFNNDGGRVAFAAQNILLDNSAAGAVPGAVSPAAGTLAFEGDVIRLGTNDVRVDQFSLMELSAANGVVVQGTGSLEVSGAALVETPLLTGGSAADHAIRATGALDITTLAGTATITSGLGAKLQLTGASVRNSARILLPGGDLTMQSSSGNVTAGGVLDVSGTARQYFDLTKFTDGGRITLSSATGNIAVPADAQLIVKAQSGGGSAGILTVNAPAGTVNIEGALDGSAGTGGRSGSAAISAGSLAALAGLDALLNAAHFNESRSYRALTGDVAVNGPAKALNYSVSADQGSLTVSDFIDASGTNGGNISLNATGSVTLAPAARLSAGAANFNAAGKGGSIEIEAGAPRNGIINTAALLDIQSGSTIDLAVAANTAGSAVAGQFQGTLHLRAPQTDSGIELQMNPILGGVTGASSIVVEGYKLYDLTGSGAINAGVQDSVRTNATAFGNAGPDILNRLLTGPNAAMQSITGVQPGAEIFNLNGDLTLAATWDLSTFRFGPQNLPGVLTLRASGNLNFDFTKSLSDGFGGGAGQLWQQPLLAAGNRSWAYRLTAGADFGAADYRTVQPLSTLAAGGGSLIMGSNGTGTMTLPTAYVNVIRDGIITPRYQTIRTGTGDITINAGRDVQILNPLGTIYTAGTQAAVMANFDQPDVTYAANTQSPLGISQAGSNPYPAQYSLAGGNVSISAQQDIAHYRVDTSGQLVADSTREMPTNWLCRRGYVDPVTGEFAATRAGRDVGSTSWWVDFSNFYEGVGALGGGNVTMTAGRDVANVDAVIPTNARMPKGTPDAGALLELGGGDLTVRAGRDIDGGVYYVERGTGTIAAGGSIRTNSTRAAMSQGQVANILFQGRIPDATSWLPTTLFAGKSTFDVFARGSVLLGQVANPFLLPQGINNSYHQKTWFSTYSQTAGVDVSALTGDVTLQSNSSGESPGTLYAWYSNVLRYSNSEEPYGRSQPWLRLAETDVSQFAAAAALMPGTLRATAFSGDINLAGGLTLSPAAIGTIDFAAAGAINGLRPNSLDSLTGSWQWGTSTINLSDADPLLLPRITAPLTLPGISTTNNSPWLRTPVIAFLDPLNARFLESGSTTGNYAVLQTKQTLHATGILHAGDTMPLRLYAGSGDISGITLFSGKSGRVFAGGDITDISLYMQNVRDSDITVVSSGRDIVAYNPNAPLRTLALSDGNVLVNTPAGLPTAGDLQISGPGTIEVLAGRHLDLGVGPTNADRTALGLVSIGNARNPALPFEGSDIVAAAGLGAAGGLDNPNLDFAAFIEKYVTGATAIGEDTHQYLAEILVGKSFEDWKKLTGEQQQALVESSADEFDVLSEDQQRLVAINIFYNVLRDTGRARGKTGNYEAGETAIRTLFKGDSWKGDMALTSREIKTQSGGNISLLAPGGKLTVGLDATGSQALDQGIFTESGGTISIFAHESVAVGTSRIFTLRGGDEMIWSSTGDIAAGASSKTVQSAPPTRVLIDPQSGDVKTDLVGLATGGGIGVLATVAGVAAGNVDLIAPKGTIDAGDAGIRVTGNINIAANNVVNAGNIAAGGSSVGTPAAPSTGGGTTTTPTTQPPPPRPNDNTGPGSKPQPPPPPPPEPLSVITAEVLGYGGGTSDEDEQERKRRRKQQEEEEAKKANEGTQ